ncbi:MAG: hypothetical protein ACRBCL_07235 [Maritimibacter sp.]
MPTLMRLVASCGLAIASLFMDAKEAKADNWWEYSATNGFGFQTFELNARYATGTTGAMRIDGTVGVAITPYHAIQGDLGVVKYDWSWWGVIGVHLSMTPSERIKYGLFASISDADDLSMFEWNAGVELGWAPTERSYVQVRAGMGWITPGGNDYLFISADGVYGITDSLRATAHLSFVNYEETGARANQFVFGAGLEYDIGSTPITAYGGIERTFSVGASDLRDETRIVAGVRLRMGRQNGTSVRDRPWTQIRPFEGHMAANVIAGTF